MRAVLLVLIDLLMVAMIVLIFLKFRLDRAILRVDMRWRAVRSLLCALAAEALESGEVRAEVREAIKTFKKSRKQKSQVACANQLTSLLSIPEADALELTERCKRYNEDVKQFNQKLERQPWRFVAVVFRVKPRLVLEFV